MILILDNNQYRRHEVYLDLYFKGYLVAEQNIDEADYYTKPNVTVYLNPSNDTIKSIKRENTVYIVAKNSTSEKLPKWINVIPLDNDIAKNIISIFESNCSDVYKRHTVGIVTIENNQIAVGGALISLSEREMKIARLFYFNDKKSFMSYDACKYFDFRADAETGFISAVQYINTKCRKMNREKLIESKNGRYFANPDLTEY